MGILVQPDVKQVEIMNNPPQAMATATSSGTKVERRIIEKNRRNQMKMLYSQLNSLLPNQNSKEPLSLPEQIDEAINYIKSLESNLHKAKQKRDTLLKGKKRSLCNSSTYGYGYESAAAKPPQIQIHENGSTIEVVLTTSLHNHFIFYDIIRILDQQQAHVVQASFSASGSRGDSIVHLVRAEMDKSMLDFGATRITEKLRKIVDGSASDEELHHNHEDQDYFWDFQILHPQMWDF